MKDKKPGNGTHKEDEHRTLSKKIAEGITLHFPQLDSKALMGYTAGQHRSEQPGAISDIDIYDPSGVIVIQGREFHSKVISFWRPVQRTTVPNFASPGSE